MDSSHPISMRKLIEYLDNVISSVGFALNIMLLYLIIYKTSSRLRDYRPILLQNCLIDIFYNVLNTLTKGQVDQKNGFFYVFMIGPLENIPFPYNNLLISIWVLAIVYCVTAIPVQFIYRYLMIVKGIKVTFKYYCMLLFSAFVPAFIYASWTFCIFWATEDRWEEAAALLRADDSYYEGIPNFVFASIDEWPLKILFSYIYIILSIVYGITIFASIKVWRHLKTMESQMSVQVRDDHRQITMTLFLQATIPCVVSFLPILTTVTTAFMHITLPGLGALLGLLFAIVPVVNPLLPLLVIRNYRQNMMFMFKIICAKRNRRVEPISKPTIAHTTSKNKKGVSTTDILEQIA